MSDIQSKSAGRNQKKKVMQSAKLQYIMPDEDIRGGKNHGVIGQYPYFAPDGAYLKKAPKMTKADELYLRKFMAARDHKDIARTDKNVIADRQLISSRDGDDGPGKDTDGNVNVATNINTRLFLERNRQYKPEQVSYRTASGEKISLTNQIFGEHKYF